MQVVFRPASAISSLQQDYLEFQKPTREACTEDTLLCTDCCLSKLLFFLQLLAFMKERRCFLSVYLKL